MAQEAGEEVKNLIKEGDNALKDKIKEYEKKGKAFRFDSYGPGVMPQEDFDKLRYPDDPEYEGE
jgi:hypothetical protein